MKLSFLKKDKIIFILFVLIFSIWMIVFLSIFFNKNNSENGLLKVIFFDVGQGDSVFIETPNGSQILYDGGPDYKVLEQLEKVMPRFDKTLDMVIASHSDADHINGLISVFDFYKVKKVLINGDDSDSQVYRDFLSRLEVEKSEKVIARSGMEVFSSDGVFIKIIQPNFVTVGSDNNLASVVVLIQYKDRSFLLTGDIPVGVERQLINIYDKELDVDVLKLGHHGSDTSSSVEFLKATSPEYSVVSAGFNNRYGHPKKTVIENANLVGSKVLETSKIGNIIFQTDGYSLFLE